MQEIEHIIDAFVERVRQDPAMPTAPSLEYSQIADHVGAMLADIAAALVTLEDSGGAPTMLLSDAADLQRFIADRHGVQRARLGWTMESLARQHVLLREETDAHHSAPASPSRTSPRIGRRGARHRQSLSRAWPPRRVDAGSSASCSARRRRADE